MAEHSLNEPQDLNPPDWAFDSDEELRKHADGLIVQFANILPQIDNCKERPVGEVVATSIALPCHDESNVTAQAIYVGHLATSCREHGLVVRYVATRESDEGVVFLEIILSTAAGLSHAQAELMAEEHPEKSTRTH